MSCFEESRDGAVSINVRSDAGTHAGDKFVNGLKDQLSAIVTEFPDLLKQDVDTANAELRAKGLLPGFELIGTTGDDGVQRNAAGEPVKLTAENIGPIFKANLHTLALKETTYQKLFDKYHSGTDWPLLSTFNPEKLTLGDIQNQLAREDLPQKDRDALTGIVRDVFGNYFNVRSEEPQNNFVTSAIINYWRTEESRAVLQKASSFMTGGDLELVPEGLLDQNGKFSRFDWENENGCAFSPNGSYVPDLSLHHPNVANP